MCKSLSGTGIKRNGKKIKIEEKLGRWEAVGKNTSKSWWS